MVGFALPETRSKSNARAKAKAKAKTPTLPACQSAHERALLVPYAFFLCTPEDADRFEDHLLTCSPCFDDLVALDRARALLGEALPD